MGEDKNINLMPEDLRKKEDLIKKSSWSFVPDLSKPLNTSTSKGINPNKQSGSNPSFWSKMFVSLKPAPRIRPVTAALNNQSVSKSEPLEIASLKSPIYVAPDLSLMNKPVSTLNKVEEHIQDFVSDKKVKVPKIKSTGPSWWSKLKSEKKVKLVAPAPIVEEKVATTLAGMPALRSPIYTAPEIKTTEAKPAPAPIVFKEVTPTQNFMAPPAIQPLSQKSSGPSWWAKLLAALRPKPRAPKLVVSKKNPAIQPTSPSPVSTPAVVKTVVQTQNFMAPKEIKPVKIKANGPSWWARLLAWFKPKPHAPKLPKPSKAEASVLVQAVKRNGYQVQTATMEMHQPDDKLASSPKQDLKNLNNNKASENIVSPRPMVIEPISQTIAPASPEPVLPKIEPKIVSQPDFTIPNQAPASEQMVKIPNNQPSKGQFHQPELAGKGILSNAGNSVDLIPTAAKMRSLRQISSLLLLASIASIIIVGVFYGALFVQEQAIIKEQRLQQTAMLEVEKEILNFNDLNKNIKSLNEEINLVQEALNKHIYWTQFFALLEKYTLPEVYYAGISAGNNGALTLSATTDSYEAVARQLKALQQESAQEFVQSVAINSASLGGNGVSFSINLVLNPNLFYYDK